jgi:transcription initiation factor TFIIB
MTAYAEVNRICVNLGLSKEIEREAIELCRKAQKEKLFVGRGGIEKSVAAILLIVCRANKIPISVKEIASASFFPKKEILAKAKAIKKKFGIHITASIDHYAFLPSFCSKLRLNIQVESLARKIIEIAEEQNLINDKRPSGVTAAAIYIAASAMGDQKKQKEIAIVSSLSDSGQI